MTEERPQHADPVAASGGATGSASAHAAAEPLSTSGAGTDEAAHAADGKHLLHEVLTMALYISLSLLAVLLASPEAGDQDHRWQEGLVVLGTGVALLIAHGVAYRMSTRLVNEGLLTSQSRDAMKASALGGLPVALLASVPVFVLGEDPGETVAEALLLLLVLGVGYRTARFSTSKVQALLYVVGIFLITTLVVLLKLVVGH